MSESAIHDYAKAKGFHRQTLERWLSWKAADRDALEEIVVSLKIGENHLRDMMEWLEEISLRDRVSISEILASRALVAVKTDPRLGRADRLKRIKEQLRRLRYPRLAGIEDAIRQKIQALKLPAEIRLSVPAGLEGGRLQVEFSATSLAELQSFTDRLSAAAASNFATDIFALMSGRPAVEDLG
ncbi:MAG TPA: hypothetical protein VKR81_04740 [Candidatus Binatia bacterium]|nr:hypothetical protein [Candidatus Binatia bacterium]